MQENTTHPYSPHRPAVHIPPIKILKVLAATIFVLLLANLASIYYENYVYEKTEHLSTLSRSFDFNQEQNVPTFFSVVILLLATGLLFLVHAFRKQDRKDGRKWLLLGCVFLFMALDESVQIHEYIANVVRPRLPTDLRGFLYWAWVVPYGALVLAVGAYFLGFVLRLPILTRNLFLLSGAMFVSGAIGLELFEGYFYKLYDLNHIYNKVLYCAEELLEMSAVVLFIYALLDYLASFRAQLYVASEATPHAAQSQTTVTGETSVLNRDEVRPERKKAAGI